jgi:hypothetical protein
VDDELEVATLSAGTAAFNCKAKLLAIPPALAVRVVACAVPHADTAAVKLALVAPDGTVTVAGSVTAVLLLDRLTLVPPLPAAALNVTVQASVPDPVIELLVHVNALSCVAVCTPVPLRLTVAVVPLIPLLLLVTVN